MARTRFLNLGATLAVLVAGAGVLGAAPASAAPAPTTPAPNSAAVCPEKPSKGHATCMSRRRTDIPPRKASAVSPMTTPSGYSPTDLRSAYQIPTGLGAGTTIAIVDAMDNPQAETDLAVYRSQYGLPACTTANGCFRKVSQTGSTSALPAANTGWGGEISLDVQMASAVCPACKILLVEAKSTSMTDLGIAVNYAASQPGVKAISNSWGGSESSSDASMTTGYFTHPGIAITASSGDSGYGTSYPAGSPKVIAVGGTSLSHSSSARGWSEAAWSGAGSGCSGYEAKPAWQVDTGCTKRSIADVSAVADPSTGVAVYDAYSAGGWAVYGGTSVASPIVASMFALANPAVPSASTLYAAANLSGLNDVTSGSNGTCGTYLCKGLTGYDGPTGMGTPKGLLALGGVTGGGGGVTSTFSMSVAPASGSLTAGGSTTTTVSTATTAGSPQSVALSASGAPAGMSVSFNPTSVTSGSSSTMMVSTTSAVLPGSYTLVVSGTGASSNATASYPLTVVAAPTSGGSCVSGQVVKNGGFESGATSWTATSGVIGANAGSHTGSWDAWLDGYGSTHTDSVSQTLANAGGCTKASVSFWLKVSTAETTTITAFDKLQLQLGSTTLGTWSNLTRTNGWAQVTLNTSLPAGTTAAAMKFTGTEDSGLSTSFYLDDVTVTLS